MANHSQSSLARNRQQLVVLGNCLAALKQMTLSLVNHDLSGLEQSLEQEAELLSQLASLQELLSSEATEIEAPLESVAASSEGDQGALTEPLRQVARDIQVASALNSTLIDNGLRFSHALLNAICPPATYRTLISHQPLIGAEAPVQPLISVQF